MPSKLSSSISRIRQACCIGMPSHSFMPTVIAELRSIVPAACGQFTWSNADGRLVNFWCDAFMPRRTAWIILHHRRYEQDAGFTFRDLALFGARTGNARSWWKRGFEESQTYAAVFRPYGFKWFLDGVVRDTMRPYGVLALIRRADDPDFTSAEEEVLGQILPYIAHGMRVAAAAPSRFVSGGRSAMLVCGSEGTIIEWSIAAHRLAVYALVDDINLDAPIAAGDFEQMTAEIQDIARSFQASLAVDEDTAAVPTLVRRNGRGEFVFRGYQLAGSNADPHRLGILIEQCIPLEAHLLERVNDTDLPTRQKEVVLLSLKGVPNALIAKQMNISPHTLKDYLKSIYARLEVTSQQELARRLLDDVRP